MSSKGINIVPCLTVLELNYVTMKNLLTLILIMSLSIGVSFAASVTDEETQDPVNQTDANGKKQGHWVYYGKDKGNPEYKDNEKVEEGPYKDNRKHGMWKAYYPGEKLKSEIEYKYNRPNGAYTKYYENGNTMDKGTWKGNKFVGAKKTFYPDGKPKEEKNYNTAGKADGKQVLYHPNGKKQLEYATVNGVENGTATTYYSNGDVKKVTTFNNGTATKVEEKDPVNPLEDEKATGPASPDAKGDTNDGTAAQKLKDGFHKTYNSNNDLEMSGEFKNGKLWNGKWYKYDSNGLLLKIEIYKDGKYFGDGVMEF